MVTVNRRFLLTGGGLTAFLTLVHVTNDAFTSMLAVLLPTLQLRFGVSEMVLAIFVATLSLSSSMTQPLFGALADRLGRRLVGALGVTASSSLLSLMGIAPTIWILFGLLLLGGLGSAAFHPSATSMARGIGKGNEGLGVAIFSAGGSVGVALGPIIVLYVVANFGITATPWLMVPGIALGMLLYAIIPPEKNIHRVRRAKPINLELFFGPVGLLVVVGVFRSVPFITFVNAMPLWLVNAQGLATDSAVIAWTLAVFSIAVGVGGILAGALTNRYSVRAILVGSIIFVLPVLFVTLLSVPGSPLYFTAVGLAGGLLGPGLPLLIVSAQDLAPQAVATASGMLGGLTAGTAGLLYILVGWLQEFIGLGPAIGVSYLFLIPSAVLTYRVLRT